MKYYKYPEDYNKWKKQPNTTIENDDTWTEPCVHPEHNPPSHIWIPPGKRLRHKCPGCGKETVIRSANITW